MSNWNIFTKKRPDHYEPVLCFLNNGQQIILALDEDNQTWAMYNGDELEDAHVVAWQELEAREEIEKQLANK